MINKDYRRVQEILQDLKPEVKSALQEMKQASVESMSSAKDTVNRTVHDRPWLFIGCAVAVGGVFGMYLGRKALQPTRP